MISKSDKEPGMRARLIFTLPMMCALGAPTLLAQDPSRTSPLDATTKSPADQPITAVTEAPSSPELQRVLTELSGSFIAEAKDNQPALRMNAAPVRIDGLGQAILFEISRADNPAEPFRVGLMQPYTRQGALRLRVLDPMGNPGLKDVLVGLWTSPASFPKLALANLVTNVDMPLMVTPDDISGKTPQPFPTLRDGAIELVSSIRISKGEISIAEQGFDADGKPVWGRAAGDPIVFKHTENPGATAKTLDGGLVVITLIAPKADAPVLAENGELTAHYTGWLIDGTRFDSSRQAGREPFKIRIPGPVIKGWNEGLKGIAKGERRRLIIPAALGYGDRGAARGLIPAGATLVFDVEALHIDNTQPPAPPTQPQPTPAPAKSDQPIGNPATGSNPEKPK
jgi:hypothetical protein